MEVMKLAHARDTCPCILIKLVQNHSAKRERIVLRLWAVTEKEMLKEQLWFHGSVKGHIETACLLLCDF